MANLKHPADPRVQVLRDACREWFGETRWVYNDKRAGGRRRVKVWVPMSAAKLAALEVHITAALEKAGVALPKFYPISAARFNRKRDETNALSYLIAEFEAA